MGVAQRVRCRDNHFDDPTWLTDTAAGALLCEYLLSHHNNNVDINHNENNASDDITTTTIALKAQCYAELEPRIARAVPKHAREIKCSNSIFAFAAPWNRAFWAGIALFVSYWILFGLILGTMAIEACREACGKMRETDDGSRECGDEEARLIVKEGYTKQLE